ncbi:dual specificity mitogen-activated protein kinase kinase 7 isoform X3 [Pogoniulus pusillus]|uniref:dual specificity mitogen-activated protein kinase kinase 7 isoform X3 n=1 Tax=Pogoniulus pusillus TaxID=488313 RepID=UPI0030B9897D
MAASSLEQKLSRLEAKLKQENREARRRIDLNLDISPARARPIIVITLSPAPAPSQRAALQLPLVSDGGVRGGGPAEAPPAVPPAPARPRQMLGLPPPPFLVPRSHESIEIDQKLQEIMKQTGYLTVGGQRYQAEINDLENLGEIGSGTCGQVWKMRFRKTGDIIAVKQMRRSGNREENKRILMDLDVVLKSHDCPYIVQCFGTFITNTDVFIAMELMGTCAEKLKKRIQGPIPERILGKMTVAIVKALFYLKEKHGVIHRDVKPSNILLDERGQVKLCDFGISGRLVDSKAKTRSAGCAAYMAVELATGQFPYQNCKTDFEVLTKVLQEDPPLLPPSMGFSGDFQAFVRDCLTKDHRKRPKYNKLLEHPFIKRFETLEVDVASWFKEVMARTESPRAASLAHHHLPFFTRSMRSTASACSPPRTTAAPPPPQNPAHPHGPLQTPQAPAAPHGLLQTPPPEPCTPPRTTADPPRPLQVSAAPCRLLTALHRPTPTQAPPSPTQSKLNPKPGPNPAVLGVGGSQAWAGAVGVLRCCSEPSPPSPPPLETLSSKFLLC